MEYAEGGDHRSFQVSVTAEVISDVHTGKKETTNVFHFTFARGKESPVPVRRLMPRTYGEAMKYLQAKRRKKRGIEFQKEQLQEFETELVTGP